MVRTSIVSIGLMALSLVLFVPGAWAQQSPSGIAGVVRDTSAAVLPGVTVEASSPVLIEKVRTVVTDGEGRYNIVDLRPGIYVVTFSLGGFSTIRREGIELTAAFTATVNAEMRVGSLEETITVTGASPLVDTQNVRQQKVMSNDLLTTLPTGQTSVVNLIALTPGYTGNATVGGSTGAYHSQQTKGQFHGKRGSHVKFDGMRIDNFTGAGDSAGYLFNSQIVEETAVESGGAGAESGAPNVAINMIPKEGGNTFRYGVTGLFTNQGLQSDNLDDTLRARGLQSVPRVTRMYDAGVTVGGPIRTDRLWFFTSIRRWGVKNQAAGLFWNKTQGTPFYTPDLDRPAHRDEKYQSHAVRVTWQVSPKNKVNIFNDLKKDCVCESGGASTNLGSGATSAQEAVLPWRLWPNGAVQGTWTSPRTSKLLLEAGAAVSMFHYPDSELPGVELYHVSIVEQSTNFRYNAPSGWNPLRKVGDRYAQRFAVSYVTGSHTFKAGVQQEEGQYDHTPQGRGRPEALGVSYTFLRGVPVSLTQTRAPSRTRAFQKAELGIYAQDQWAVKRLTLNYGLRFDYYNGYVPEHHLPATQYLPAQDFDAVHKAPEWKDVNPRLGAAYDLFGDGRTALKVALGRYQAMSHSGIASSYIPVNTSVNTVNRPWTDTNGNYIPECDFAKFGANGECGPINNQNFGKNDPGATRYADDVRYGWGIRPFTWDVASEVQHQLGPGVSLTAGYYHNWDGNSQVTDNLAVTPSDYDPYCITAPVDARLPGGGGYQVCGLYDVKPAKFGQVTNLVTQASNFGRRTRVNDFVGASLDMRLGSGMRFGGGVDTGRTVEHNCIAIDSPQELLNCRVVTPFSGATQVKLNGSYPLRGDFVVSGTFQNLPGQEYTANYPAPNAQIAPSLGRSLAGGTRSATAPLIAPGTQRESRRTQVDLRLAKIFQVGAHTRLAANFDLYNALNANSVLGANNTYGAQWRQPTLILNGRLIQFSGNLTF